MPAFAVRARDTRLAHRVLLIWHIKGLQYDLSLGRLLTCLYVLEALQRLNQVLLLNLFNLLDQVALNCHRTI